MILTGIADEAGDSINSQIAATKALGWEHLEARFLSVGNFEKEVYMKYRKKHLT